MPLRLSLLEQMQTAEVQAASLLGGRVLTKSWLVCKDSFGTCGVSTSDCWLELWGSAGLQFGRAVQSFLFCDLGDTWRS